MLTSLMRKILSENAEFDAPTVARFQRPVLNFS